MHTSHPDKTACSDAGIIVKCSIKLYLLPQFQKNLLQFEMV